VYRAMHLNIVKTHKNLIVCVTNNRSPDISAVEVTIFVTYDFVLRFFRPDDHFGSLRLSFCGTAPHLVMLNSTAIIMPTFCKRNNN
jgi:hypothetical protein